MNEESLELENTARIGVRLDNAITNLMNLNNERNVTLTELQTKREELNAQIEVEKIEIKINEDEINKLVVRREELDKDAEMQLGEALLSLDTSRDKLRIYLQNKQMPVRAPGLMQTSKMQTQRSMSRK